MGGYGPLYDIQIGKLKYPCNECETCGYVKECLDVCIPQKADDCYVYCEYYDKLQDKGEPK